MVLDHRKQAHFSINICNSTKFDKNRINNWVFVDWLLTAELNMQY